MRVYTVSHDTERWRQSRRNAATAINGIYHCQKRQ